MMGSRKNSKTSTVTKTSAVDVQEPPKHVKNAKKFDNNEAAKQICKTKSLQNNSRQQQQRESLKANSKDDLTKNKNKAKQPKSDNERNAFSNESTVNLLDDLFSADKASSVSSGYHSLLIADDSGNVTEQQRAKEDVLLADSASESSEESEDETEVEAEAKEEVDPEFEGECALDMFIDPLNPMGKAVHSTLQSKINDQKDREEDLKRKRAEKLQQIKAERERQKQEKLRQLQLEKEQKKREKEYEKLKRRLENVHIRQAEQRSRTDALNGRMAAAKEREANYYRRYEVWKDKMEALYQEQLEITIPLEEECSGLRGQLYAQQKTRMEAFKAKMDPIIIREGPSRSANYKMQAKYLQYEIYPLTQRFRLTQMRADGEEMKRRGVEKEVWQLRDKISDYNTKISVATKGVPVSKTMLSKISDHKKKWKLLCNSVKIAKELSRKKSSAAL